MSWTDTPLERSTADVFEAVLFDRDGTLIHDVPYCSDPAQVRPIDGVRAALDELRAGGLRLGVVSNQSGIGRGILTPEQVGAVNARVEELLGPFGTWQVCPHHPGDGCACRKPGPQLILDAAKALGTHPTRCVVVGDIGSDMQAALAAGAAAVMIPTDVTRAAEIAAAPAVVADLAGAVDWIRYRQRMTAATQPAPAGRRVLAVRPDSMGDVLLTGPAIRAVADRAVSVTLWCGPRGVPAAELLPGVSAIFRQPLPWIDAHPQPVVPQAMHGLVEDLRAARFDEAIVFTSFHQSPLPTALLLRMAGVERISAISDDYPGSLLDVRHRVRDGVAEPLRALSLAAAAGYARPDGDDGRLRVTVSPGVREPNLVVLHAGSHASARSIPDPVAEAIHGALTGDGWKVAVTSGPDEGGLDDLRELAELLGRAACAVVGNTGPAHLAAAVGTPVVSLFAPTVPFGQWAPYGVPVARFGDPLAPCAGSRTTRCRSSNDSCLSDVDVGAIVAAVHRLAGREDAPCAS